MSASPSIETHREDTEPTLADAYAAAPEPVARDTREQERQLIGYVLAHPSSVNGVVLDVPPADMSTAEHAILWQLATERAYAGHTEMDSVAIVNHLKEIHPEYPALPKRATDYAINLGIATIGVVAETLAEEVSKGAAARDTERKLLSAWQNLAAGYDQRAREIMTSVDPNVGARDRWASLTTAWEAAKADAENPSAIIPTPWKAINRYFEGGLRSRQVYVLAGMAGTGKTASAQQVVDHAAGQLGHTVAVFSLEMGQEDLSRRQMSTSGRVPMSEVMRPDLKLTKESFAAVDEVLDRIGERVLIDDSEELLLSEARSRARVAVRRHKAELLVFDYSQLVEYDNDKLSEREKISEVVKGISRLAKELHVPVLLLAQPNRNANYQDRKLEMTDLYGSGALEKFPAGVILLNKVTDTDDEGNKIGTEFVDFDIRKNRFGQNDVTVRMLADLSRQRFEELST